MIKKRTCSVEDFKTWLTRCGAEVLAPTSEWEVVRVATNEGVLVAYRNKSGKEKWPERLAELWQFFVAGKAQRLAVSPKRRKKERGIMEELSARDGWSCWFCGDPLPEVNEDHAPDLSPTLEHLLPVAHGGSNHVSNLCLAHRACNVRAGNLSVVEKVAFREQLRAEVNG